MYCGGIYLGLFCKVLPTWRLGPPFSPWISGLKTGSSPETHQTVMTVLEQLLSASCSFKLDCFSFCRLSSVFVASPSILLPGISYNMNHLHSSHWIKSPWLLLWPSSLLWLLYPPSSWQLSKTTWPLLLQLPHRPFATYEPNSVIVSPTIRLGLHAACTWTS